MAPEVIREQFYGVEADVWSLGITAIELAEIKPPHAEIHPMRALFMIPFRDAPVLKAPRLWSSQFHDFLAKCLVKKQIDRATVKQLMQHPWVKTRIAALQANQGVSLPLKSLMQKNAKKIKEYRDDDLVSVVGSVDPRVSALRGSVRLISGILDSGRPISSVLDMRAGSKKALVSMQLDPDQVEEIRKSFNPLAMATASSTTGGGTSRLNRQSMIIQKATDKKNIEVDELFELLDSTPLTDEEKAGMQDMQKRVTMEFMRALYDMI